MLFLIHVGFEAVSIAAHVMGLQLPGAPSMTPLHWLTEMSLPIGLGLAWWYVARGSPPRSALLACDAIVPLALSVIYIRLMFVQRPPDAGLILLVLVSLALVLRAALVPSSVTRTWLVGAGGLTSAVLGSVFIGPELETMQLVWLAVMGGRSWWSPR